MIRPSARHKPPTLSGEPRMTKVNFADDEPLLVVRFGDQLSETVTDEGAAPEAAVTFLTDSIYRRHYN